MEQNLKFHTRTVSIADIMGEQWVVVLYFPPILTPACAHWQLQYQRPEFICQTCFERFPVENVTLVMTLEELLDRVTAYMFTDYARVRNELRELEGKLNDWEGKENYTGTVEPQKKLEPDEPKEDRPEDSF